MNAAVGIDQRRQQVLDLVPDGFEFRWRIPTERTCGVPSCSQRASCEVIFVKAGDTTWSDSAQRRQSLCVEHGDAIQGVR